MMKNIIIIILLFTTTLASSQTIYKSTGGEVSFFSVTPLEDIDAVNKKIRALINTKNGDFAFIITNIGFHFKKPLMEEHFNENYMESDKYKTSVFKGKIEGAVDYTKNGTYKVKAKGVLNIHGVDQEREIESEIVIKDGAISVKSKFKIKLKDHKIKIPKMVIKNIAETVDVTVNINFAPKSK